MNNELIYGKNKIERVTSIEVNDNETEIFIETESGDVQSQILSNKFWILSPVRYDQKWVKLKGDLHYKYGKQFTSREDFYAAKRYYKNHDIFLINDPKESFMVKDGLTYFKNLKHNEVSILSFDIESTTLEHNDNSKVLLISNTFRKNGIIERKLFAYDDYETDYEFFDDWCNWVKEKNPSIIIGHNIFSYDFPYLDFCASKAGTTLNLGRDNSKIKFDSWDSHFRIDGNRTQAYRKAKIYGREIVDTYFLSIKYDIGRKYESYSLKSIIKSEGLEIKDRQFYDASQIRSNYKDPNEWIKIKKYAEHDADDSLSIYDLMSAPYFYMTQSIPKSYQEMMCSATGSQINSMMMRAYLQQAHSLPKASEEIDYEGAISFGNPGIWRNCLKVDVASLYPSIIIEYEVCDKEKDPEGYFLKIVKTFTDKRLEYKKLSKENKYYDDLQGSFKILINSAYGFLATGGLIFNSPSKAAFITETGREILKHVINWAETNNFKIINADTDSISFCKSDQSFISKEERINYINEINSMYPDRIKWADDGYFSTIIVLKAKNYVLVGEDNKVKIKGSALKATTKEPALREFINEIITSMIENRISTSDYLSIYNKYIKEILDIKDIKRWASRKTITDKVLKSERTNETKIKDAIKNSEYTEGDRCYVYFKQDESLGLVENYNGDYSKPKLLGKLHDTSQVFESLIDVKIFPNYKLKKNYKSLTNS